VLFSILDTYTHTAEIQDKQFTSRMYPVKAQTQNNSSRVEYKAQSDPFQKVTEVLFGHVSYSKSLLKINHVQQGS